MRQAVLGEEIQLFGDGGQKRDFDYVDDVVDAFLRAGAMDAADGQVFNLGGEAPVSLLELVKMMIEIAGQGSYRWRPSRPSAKRIDIGDFYADTTKIRNALGWQPRVAAARRAASARSTTTASTRSIPVSRPSPSSTSRPTCARCAREIDAAVARVLDSGWFILGPEGEAFERELAAWLRRAGGGRGRQRHRGDPARAGSAGHRRRRRGRSPRPSPPPSPPSASCARARGRCSPTSTPRP